MKNTTAARVTEFVITGFDYVSNQKLLGSIILITYLLVLLFCLTNSSIIFIERQLHLPMYALICNLAFVDVLFSTSSSITMISVLLTERKTISFFSCITGMYAYHLGDICECLTITMMAIDRMLAISVPLRYNSILTLKRCVISILASWIIGMAALSTTAILASEAPFCQPVIPYVFCDYAAVIRTACVNPGPYFSNPLLVGLWMWLLGGHFSVIILSYFVIVYKVLRLSDKKGQQKMMKTCISHIIVVSAFYAPKLVSVLLTRIGVNLNQTERNAIIIIASTLPPLINPVVYCVTTKELRTRLVNRLSKKRVAIS